MLAQSVRAQWRRDRSSAHHKRRGAIIVLAAFLMVILLGFCAFAVDLGYIANTKTELSRAVDAGALAGAAALPQGLAATTTVVRQYVKANVVGAREIKDEEIRLESGHWDSRARRFWLSNERPSALRVVVERPGQPLFFGLALGRRQLDLRAEAIAEFQPRDIMVTLDFAAPPSGGSTFGALETRGRAAIEDDLLQIYEELGQPIYGNMAFSPRFIESTSASTIKKHLGLTGVTYPYPRGSWDEFIHHVTNNEDLRRAGYQRKYGYMTLIHYWMVDRPMQSEARPLQSIAQQPITALKNSMESFLSFMKSQNSNDRLGLTFNPRDQAAIPGQTLTADFDAINETMRNLQAGHNEPYASIDSALRTSRMELEKHARSGALRMIVLMTGGIAGRPVDDATARGDLLNEAKICADTNIRVCTISTQTDIEAEFMQRVADVTGGKHFCIPGDKAGDEYENGLQDALEQIAKLRPVRLVQ